MLLSVIFIWILQLVLVQCLYSSFDSISRPKPVNCSSTICLQFTNHIANKSGLIPVQQFGLQSAIGGEEIIFWMIDTIFLAYHNQQIHILGPDDNDPSLLQITSTIKLTIESTHRVIIIGNDTLITYFHIEESSKPILPEGTSVDLIKLYTINVNDQSLTLLDSISLNSIGFSELNKLIIDSATTVEGFIYLSGIRTVGAWDEAFTVRLCSKHTLRSFVDIYQPANRHIDRIKVNRSLIYSMAIEPASVLPHSRLLIAYRTSEYLYIVSLNGSLFDYNHKECLSGRGKSLISRLTNSFNQTCSNSAEQVPEKIHPCDDNPLDLPSSWESVSSSWATHKQVRSLTMVYINFPVHSHIVVYISLNGSVVRCPLRTSLFSGAGWGCERLGDLENLDNMSVYPPFLNITTQSIEIYNPTDSSIKSYNLMSCSYLTNCLACNLFGHYFSCKWKVQTLASSCIPFTGNTTVNNNITDCFRFVSLLPEAIILTDPLVQFKLTFTVPDGSMVNGPGYEFVVYVAGDPCFNTTHFFDDLGTELIVTCTLSNRKKGTWPVTWSVGVNQNQRFANRFLTSNQWVNITIDGIPVFQRQKIVRQGINYFSYFLSITITLIVSFVLSLTLKRKPAQHQALYNESETISIPQQIKTQIATKNDFITSSPSLVRSHETKTSLLSNRL